MCIDGTLTAQRYVDNILQPVIPPFLQQNDDVTTFQQDNAPHSARISMVYLNNVNVNVMPWLVYSPDLSLIEHLCDIIKTRLDKRDDKPQNSVELIAAVQEECGATPYIHIHRLICPMRSRMVTCMAANGGHTRY